MDESTFPKYNTDFKSAFNKARDELGPNSIFKFHNKLYTTNHPGEMTKINSALVFLMAFLNEYGTPIFNLFS